LCCEWLTVRGCSPLSLDFDPELSSSFVAFEGSGSLRPLSREDSAAVAFEETLLSATGFLLLGALLYVTLRTPMYLRY